MFYALVPILLGITLQISTGCTNVSWGWGSNPLTTLDIYELLPWTLLVQAAHNQFWWRVGGESMIYKP